MKLIKEFNFVFFLLLISCSSADKFDSQFYKTTSEWNTYFPSIGVEDTTKSNTVFLFMGTSECLPCEKELHWWNKNEEELDISVRLILMERYKQRFDAYISSNDLNLKVFRDSGSVALKDSLIPTAPVKIYFDNTSNIKTIDHMGGHGNLNTFLDVIRE